jgi:hypothetical protein
MRPADPSRIPTISGMMILAWGLLHLAITPPHDKPDYF